MIVVIILTFLIAVAECLEGYDCSNSNTITSTTVSLSKLEDCSPESFETVETTVSLQIVERKRSHLIRGYVCRLEQTSLIQGCGLRSYIFSYQKSLETNSVRLTRSECQETIRQKVLFFKGVKFSGLALGVVNELTASTNGQIDSDGNCKPDGPIVRNGVQYASAIEHLSVRLFLDNVEVERLHNVRDGSFGDDVVYKKTLSCKYDDLECFDVSEGLIIWDTDRESCEKSFFTSIYSGSALQLNTTDVVTRQDYITVFVNSSGILASLNIKTQIKICQLSLFETDQEGIMIIHFVSNPLIQDDPSQKKQLNLATYFNAKLSYVVENFKTELSQTHRRNVENLCKLERSVLMTQLSLSRILPNLVALLIKNTGGFFAIPRGEVVHLVKCVPTQVNFRQSENCYDELPVSQNGTELFLSPVTRILSDVGTQIPCSSMHPPIWLINDEWIALTPKPVLYKEPQLLSLNLDTNWVFRKMTDLSSGGLYTKEQLQDLSNDLMFPMKRTAVSNNIAGAMLNENFGAKYNLERLMTESGVSNMIDGYKRRFFSILIDWGNFWSGLIGLFAIAQCIKMFVSFIIRFLSLDNQMNVFRRLLLAASSILTVKKLIKLSSKEKETDQVDAESAKPLVNGYAKENRSEDPVAVTSKLNFMDDKTLAGHSRRILSPP